MIREIQTGKDNPLLRQKAKKVEEITPEIKELAFDMVETMGEKDGIGLAAPQVGQLIRMIVAKPNPEGKPLILINPEIKKVSFRKKTVEEGCLSLPDYSVAIKRPVKIVLEALNLENEKIRIKAEGIPARVIQHEIEHLDGILISDKNND